MATELIYATVLGTTTGGGVAIAVDSAGNAYLTGYTARSGFPVTAGAFRTSYEAVEGTEAALSVVFVTKVNPAGSALVYSTYLGISNTDEYEGGYGGIAVDSVGRAYVAGQTRSTRFPLTADAYMSANPSPFTSTAGFLTVLNPAGSALEYSSYWFPVSGMVRSATGAVYLAGHGVGSFGWVVTTIAKLEPLFVPALRIAKTNSGPFARGQSAARYTVSVSNAVGAGATSGTVTVTETIPTGVKLVSMSGTGWTCASGGSTCTRSDSLAGGATYPAITVTVDVEATAPAQVVNQVSVSGGGSAAASASDTASIFSVTAGAAAKAAIARSGLWVIDRTGDGQWNGAPPDLLVSLGQAGDTFLAGDWNGSGTAKPGIFRAGLWVLDYNGNGVWDGPAGGDRFFYLGQAGDVGIVGDWNGDGRAKAGVFRNGQWILDYNGNGLWDGPSVDRVMYLGQTGDQLVVGDWNGDGRAKAGIFRAGLWVLDYNGNGVWDGPGGGDRFFYLGQPGDTGVVGNWNGDGRAKAGIFRAGLWVLDYNGNGQWDGAPGDRFYYLGQTGDTPVIGDWNGDGRAKAGIFRGGLWVLDKNGNGVWDGPPGDVFFYLGQGGDLPLPAKW